MELLTEAASVILSQPDPAENKQKTGLSGGGGERGVGGARHGCLISWLREAGGNLISLACRDPRLSSVTSKRWTTRPLQDTAGRTDRRTGTPAHLYACILRTRCQTANMAAQRVFPQWSLEVLQPKTPCGPKMIFTQRPQDKKLRLQNV